MDEQVKMLRKVETRVSTMEEQTVILRRLDTASEIVNESLKYVERFVAKEDSARRTFGELLNRILVRQREMGMDIDEIKGATVAEGTEESESEDDGETNPGPIVDSGAATGMAAAASEFVTPPDKSPDVTMTTPTPINSQDDVQNTSTLIAAPIPLPAPHSSSMTAASIPNPRPLVTAPAHLAVPVKPPSNIPSERRRSPRIQELSRPPTPAGDVASKREAEESAGGDPKRQKLGPS